VRQLRNGPHHLENPKLNEEFNDRRCPCQGKHLPDVVGIRVKRRPHRSHPVDTLIFGKPITVAQDGAHLPCREVPVFYQGSSRTLNYHLKGDLEKMYDGTKSQR
jgi:hypothetical protein